MPRPALEKPDISEHGAPKEGKPQTSNRRVFMQLLAFGNCRDSQVLADALVDAGIEGVLYEDINDPQGTATLVLHEDCDFFVSDWRRFLQRSAFNELHLKSEYTMLGRSYSLGYEPDLVEALITRPRQTALNPQWPWAIWYPLRRRGKFSQLPHDEQRSILSEHGTIGRAFGAADYAHDIRLDCHGLDKRDNDFVIGLTGSNLHPLSATVQTMRRTTQTAQYLERLGPFFIGKAIWKSAL